MATKAELLEKARDLGLDVNSKTSKSDLESKLSSQKEGKSSNSDDEKVTVNENKDGEATRGTTRDGDEEPVKNGEEVKQNGVEEVKVLGGDNNSELVTDESRTEEEVRFADESNPNNKARLEGAGDSDFDQDGHARTGGKSYGVAANSQQPTSDDAFEQNAGEEPENRESKKSFLNPQAGSEGDTNNQEWDRERQRELRESLSDPENGITAGVTTSVGSYVRVKFFRNNLPFATYTSRDFKEEDARKYLEEQKEARGL